MRGAKCFPNSSAMYSNVSSFVPALQYGWFDVSASYTSAMQKMRAGSGIVSALSPARPKASAPVAELFNLTQKTPFSASAIIYLVFIVAFALWKNFLYPLRKREYAGGLP